MCYIGNYFYYQASRPAGAPMKYFLLALSLNLAVADAAAAPSVNVEGRRYEIGTVTGLLSSYRETITTQIWFGNSELARAFSNKTANDFGVPNYRLYGPMFAYYIYEGVGADYTTGWVYNPTRFVLPPENRAQNNNATAGNYYTYAVAKDLGPVDIPEPSSLLLLTVGAFVLVARRISCKHRESIHYPGGSTE